MNIPPKALSIAGSDSSAGAGVQADLKTFEALGVYGTTALTAITAQNTLGVRAIFELSPALVDEQIAAVMEDIGADAVKIGMLANVEIIEAVVQSLSRYRARRIVVDPVMVAKGGSRLLVPQAVSALKKMLLPIADLITPNLPEAEALVDRQIVSRLEIEEAAREILKMGPGAVLLKGGHGNDHDRCSDCLVYQVADGVAVRWFSAPRIPTRNLHGTGCTLSAAIAAFLAREQPLPMAVEHARKYLQNAIERGAKFEVGRGYGPLAHSHKIGIPKA